MRDDSLFVGPDDDVLELLWCLQTPIDADRNLKFVSKFVRWTADYPCRCLNVVASDSGDYFICGKTSLCDFLWVEPDAHRVISRSPHYYVANTRQSRELISDIDCGVVSQIKHIVAIGR